MIIKRNNMKDKETRLTRAIDVLMDAYNAGTLQHGTCKHCAVGNLLGSSVWSELFITNQHDVIASEFNQLILPEGIRKGTQRSVTGLPDIVPVIVASQLFVIESLLVKEPVVVIKDSLSIKPLLITVPDGVLFISPRLVTILVLTNSPLLLRVALAVDRLRASRRRPGAQVQRYVSRHAAHGRRPVVREHEPRSGRGDRRGDGRDGVVLPRVGGRCGSSVPWTHFFVVDIIGIHEPHNSLEAELRRLTQKHLGGATTGSTPSASDTAAHPDPESEGARP